MCSSDLGVNVGTNNSSATWIDWSHYSTSGGSGWMGGGSYYGGGWGVGGNNWSSGSGAWNANGTWNGSGGSNCGWSSCWSSSGTWSSTPSTTSVANWQGCVMDRDQSYDVNNTTPVTSNSPTLFPALYTPNCPAPMLALTDKIGRAHV